MKVSTVVWFVYLIRTAQNNLYCGITTDIQRRFKQHDEGKGAKALRGKGPLKLVWIYQSGPSRSNALKLEYAIKKLPKQRKEQLILQPDSIKDILEIV